MDESIERRKAFFEAIYRYCDFETSKIEIRGIKIGEGVLDQKWFGGFDELCDYIENGTTQPLDYFFGVSTRKDGQGNKENVIQIPALWMDIDFKDTGLKEFVPQIMAYPIRPTAIIKSGGGLHVYWRLSEPLGKEDIPKVEEYLKRIAIHFKADLQAAECARILRVPYTRNCKYNPPRVTEILVLNEQRECDLHDFDNYLPEAPKEIINKLPEWETPGFITKASRERYSKGTRNKALIDVLLYYANTVEPNDVFYHVWDFVQKYFDADLNDKGKYEEAYIKERVKWALTKREIYNITEISNATEKAYLITVWVPKHKVNMVEKLEVK